MLYFSLVQPYEMQSEGDVFGTARRIDPNAEHAAVKVERDMDNKITGAAIEIPYNDACIREIRLKGSVSDEAGLKSFQSFADRFNADYKAWVERAESDEERKNAMQVRNLGDTAASALKAAVTGGDVKETLKKGIETANEIEEGKVKQGFFGRLFKK